MKISILVLLLFIFIFILKIQENHKKINIENDKDNHLIANFYIKKFGVSKKYDMNLIFNTKNINLKLTSHNDTFETGCDDIYFWYKSSYDPVFYYGKIEKVDFILKEIFNPKNLLKILIPKDEKFADGRYGTKLKKETKFEDEKIIQQFVYSDTGLIYKSTYKYKNKSFIADEIKIFYPEEVVEIKINIKDISTTQNFNYSIPLNKHKNIQFLEY